MPPRLFLLDPDVDKMMLFCPGRASHSHKTHTRPILGGPVGEPLVDNDDDNQERLALRRQATEAKRRLPRSSTAPALWGKPTRQHHKFS